MRIGILIDATRCLGCKACAYACKESNGLPKNNVEKLSADTWSVVEKRAGLNVRRHCMHCADPACASVCPVGALHKVANGAVVYDEEKCIGCRYCMLACPFGIPKYEWGTAHPRVRKCFMCYETRVRKGKKPACTSVCPAGATVFGDRNKLIVEAQERIKKNPRRYTKGLYGLKEAGGTSVLYLSSVPFQKLGLPVRIEKEPYPRLTWAALSKIPNIAAVGGVMMVGTWWIIKRRIRRQEELKAARKRREGEGFNPESEDEE